ncbi:MAG: ATP-binding protein [Phycisphaerae bacterium]|nr:ATP-binding protein [Phycisphaerae bacterium]
MKLSIVWRCAITVAIAQVANFIIIAALAVQFGVGPIYRIWSAQVAETLRSHQDLLGEIADRDGFAAATDAAGKLSVAGRRHRVVDQAGVNWAEDYLGVPGEKWRRLADLPNEPTWHRGQLIRMTFSTALRDRVDKGTSVIIFSSSRWPLSGAIWSHPAGVGLWVGSGMLFSALVGGIVGTWFTRPILRLRTSVTRFAAGDLDARPDPRLQSRRDELGDLTRDLTRMKDRIAMLVGAQRQLLDDVAHELRSPLARMNVARELAEQTCRDALSPNSDESKQYLARIRRECERLSDMIDRLLQLAALEHQVDGDERVLINLSQLTREVADDCDFEAQAVDRRVSLHTGQDIRVLGSSDMLRAAIENIVRNAIRYTPAGRSVDINLRTTSDRPNRAVITIRDHGPGVSEDMLPKLFQPFYRVESDRSNHSGGAGLGLALAERVIRAHGGNIVARNHADGGLEFIVDLPAHVSRQPCSANIGQQCT